MIKLNNMKTVQLCVRNWLHTQIVKHQNKFRRPRVYEMKFHLLNVTNYADNNTLIVFVTMSICKLENHYHQFIVVI